MLINQEGLLEGVNYSISPNRDLRPDPSDISLLVIHAISLPPGKFGSSDIKDFFMNQLNVAADPYFDTIKDLKVSAHLLICRTGEIWQFVPFHQRAWHAGQSEFEGREKCNDYSIGIELEGTNDMPYTEAQYDQLSAVTTLLLQKYPKITFPRIVGHSEIAPGRKTDPGPHFDWEEYVSQLK